MTDNSKTALVTGASGGIGYELSKLMAADGHNLVLVARSESKLAALADELRQRHGIEVLVLPLDLSDPSAPDALYDAVQSALLTIDVLVNNAGFGLHGLFAEADMAQVSGMLQLNIIALTHLTRLFLPAMLARGRGYIMNVGSTASFQPGPLMSTYCASKAYVLNFTEAVAEEVRGSGVVVTALCPGVVITGFQQRAEVGQMRMLRGPSMTSRRVAEIAYRAMLRGKRLVVPGLFNQLLVFSTRLSPRVLTARIAKWMMDTV